MQIFRLILGDSIDLITIICYDNFVILYEDGKYNFYDLDFNLLEENITGELGILNSESGNFLIEMSEYHNSWLEIKYFYSTDGSSQIKNYLYDIDKKDFVDSNTFTCFDCKKILDDIFYKMENSDFYIYKDGKEFTHLENVSFFEVVGDNVLVVLTDDDIYHIITIS